MDVSLVREQIGADNCSRLWRNILEDINTQSISVKYFSREKGSWIRDDGSAKNIRSALRAMCRQTRVDAPEPSAHERYAKCSPMPSIPRIPHPSTAMFRHQSALLELMVSASSMAGDQDCHPDPRRQIQDHSQVGRSPTRGAGANPGYG